MTTKRPHLITFGPGPSKPNDGSDWENLPEEQRTRHCNACGGDGIGYDHSKPDDADGNPIECVCEVCNGKGRWGAEDIRLYHLKHPKICKESCGDAHTAPRFRTDKEIDETLEKLEEAFKAAEKFLESRNKQ